MERSLSNSELSVNADKHWIAP